MRDDQRPSPNSMWAKWAKFFSVLTALCMDMKWMSRQARCSGCEVLNAAVPLDGEQRVDDADGQFRDAGKVAQRARQMLRRIVLRRVAGVDGATQ